MISKLFFDTPKSCMKFWMNLRANGILPSYFDQIELLDIGQLANFLTIPMTGSKLFSKN